MKKILLLPITLAALAPMISVVGCGNPKTPTPPEPVADITIDLTEDKSHKNIPEVRSTEFVIDTSKTYCFVIHTDICNPPQTPWKDSAVFAFGVGTHIEIWHFVDIEVSQLVVRNKAFTLYESHTRQQQAGEYFEDTKDHTIYGIDFQQIDAKFTMWITLKFVEGDGQSVVARWHSGT